MEFIKVAYKRISHFDLLYGNKEALELLIAYSDFDEYIYACNEAASFLLLFFLLQKTRFADGFYSNSSPFSHIHSYNTYELRNS